MKNRNLVLCLVVVFSFFCNIKAQTSSIVLKQIISKFSLLQKIKGQEKIYLHTDKSYYLTGEKMWYKAYLLDATKHTVSDKSNFIYVELIDRNDSVLIRQKIKKDSLNGFWGTMPLPNFLLSGKYQLRAYTIWMQNSDEHTFFRKEIVVENTSPFLESEGSGFVYSKMMKRNDSIQWAKREVIIKEKKNVPDLQFFPEGGNLISNQKNVVGFKAVDIDGKSVEIEGDISDENGVVVSRFRSAYRGMGRFVFKPLLNHRYIANATTEDGRKLKVSLPNSTPEAIALRVVETKGKITYKIENGDSVYVDEQRYLIVHQRGKLLRIESINDLPKVDSISFSGMSDGIVHLLLLDEKGNPLTERLVFVRNNENQKNIPLIANRGDELTNLKFNFNNLPGSYSISISKSGEIVGNQIGIEGSILLSSDLRGYIESPESYFTGVLENTNEKLDNLMLTHGWTRFDVPKLIQHGLQANNLYPIEKGQVLSGRVKDKKGKPVAGIPVSITGLKSHLFESLNSDKNGLFCLQSVSFRDSTRFVIKAGESGVNKYNVEVDQDSFPAVKIHAPWFSMKTFEIEEGKKTPQLAPMMKWSKQVELKQVVVNAPVYQRPKSKFYMTKLAENTFDESHLKELADLTIPEALMQLCPYVLNSVVDGIDLPLVRNVSNGQFEEPGLMVNEFRMEWLDFNGYAYRVRDIESIDVFRGIISENMLSTYNNPRAATIAIMLKKGKFNARESTAKIVYPLGWSLPKDFYVPKYDSKEEMELKKPISTIFWSPNLVVDSTGNANVTFSTKISIPLRIVVEGVSTAGQLISIQKDIK